MIGRRLSGATRTLRALSLDVVGGALCGGMLAQAATGARMRPPWWIALACAVFVVYTVDHLLDARRPMALAYRHRFHRRHRRVLTAAAAGALLLGATAACFLRPEVIRTGLALAAGCALYVASAQGLLLGRLPKEPVAALLYTAGIWFGPLTVAPTRTAALACGLHGLSALLNLLVYGALETRLDARLGSRSLARSMGEAPVRRLVAVAGALGATVSLAIAFALREQRLVFLVLAAIVATPALLLHRAFACRERYRVWGDLVFWLGALPWIAW